MDRLCPYERYTLRPMVTELQAEAPFFSVRASWRAVEKGNIWIFAAQAAEKNSNSLELAFEELICRVQLVLSALYLERDMKGTRKFTSSQT